MQTISGAIALAINQIMTLIFLLIVGRVIYDLVLVPNLSLVLTLLAAGAATVIAWVIFRIMRRRRREADRRLEEIVRTERARIERKAGREALKQYLLPGWELPPEGLPRRIGESGDD